MWSIIFSSSNSARGDQEICPDFSELKIKQSCSNINSYRDTDIHLDRYDTSSTSTIVFF